MKLMKQIKKKQKNSNDKNNNNENNTVDQDLKHNENTKKKCYQIKIEK